MWPKRRGKVEQLATALKDFSENQRNLPGVVADATRETLAIQMVASLRRLDYTDNIRSRDLSPNRADPRSPMFDPERAAVWHARAGRVDEAVWLVFLATHFGKHGVHGWRLVRDVYSGLGDGIWTWERVSSDPAAFRSWLRANQHRVGGGFGNHRKYESLNPDSPAGTATVVQSYIDWIGPGRSHTKRFVDLVRAGGNDPQSIFDHFYNSMRVARFGRLGKLDFLALLGRLELAPISPGSAYLVGATGALRGARLLFAGSPTAGLKEGILDSWLCELDAELDVGMQVMEDSLCNWQKSPARFIHFRG